MENFASGMVTMGFLLAGLFFLKFFVQSRDRLFLAFATAFWLLAINQTLVTVAGVPGDEVSWLYLLRLAAFTLIAVAIVRKNTAPADVDERG